MNKLLFFSLIIVLLSSCSNKSDTNEQNYNSQVEICVEYPYYESLKDIVDASDLIISGTITDSYYMPLDSAENFAEEESLPYTIYEITVTNVFKGDYEEEIILIKCVGGIKEGVLYTSKMNEQMKAGEESLFLLKTYKDMYPSLLNDTQSVYVLSDENEIVSNIIRLLSSEEKEIQELFDKIISEV